jgi:hypothetical protein
VAVDSKERGYVADSLDHRIQDFTATDQFVGTWASVGSGDGRFLFPR